MEAQGLARRTLSKLSRRCCFLISQHSEWLQLGTEPWKEATGWESFPRCLGQRREAVTFGKTPSLCPASVLGAAARLMPLCSATRLLVLVGLEKSDVQCSHWTELGCGVMAAHPVCGSGSKASCLFSSVIQFPQRSFMGPIRRHMGTAHSLDT